MIKRSQQQQSAAQSEPLKCPRCESANTKFCYYNNYNRSQPRHFCRACKRHWTKGGTLRNVPVGGARKSNNNNNSNKRPKKPNHSSSAAEARDDQHHNDKSVSEILYQAMIAPAPFQGPLLIPPPPPPAALQLSVGSSPFDSSGSGPGPGPGPASFHNNLQVAATTNGVITPWQQLMSNNYGSLDCGWNFEDIDSLVSADHIGLPWEDCLDILKP